MLIILEGPDGTGKSTQVKLLADWLRSLQFDVVESREPGGDPKFGPTIREMLLNDGSKVSGITELYGFMFDRGLHMTNVVLPALEAKRIVICDRMFDSSLVYQGVVKGHGVHLVQQLNHLFLKGPYAKHKICCFTLDAPDDVLNERVEARVAAGASDDKHDKAGADFRQQVRDAYRFIAKNTDPTYYRETVDASGSLEQVLARLQQAVSAAMRLYGHYDIDHKAYELS